MKKFSLICLLASLLSSTQLNAQGIDFKHISYEEALKEAARQDKLIFIDFYTAWCIPCKKLAAGPFKEEANGTFYNKHFISIKLDAEKEGKEAASRYQVVSFPTLLFVNSKGNIITRGSGSREGDDMIAFGKEALSANMDQYSWENLQEQFPNKQDDEIFLKIYYQKMKEFNVNAADGIEAWLKVQTEIPENSPEMLTILQKNLNDLEIGGQAEQILLRNMDYYLSISKEHKQKTILRLPATYLRNTLRHAFDYKDAERLQLVIDKASRKEIELEKKYDINELKMYQALYSNHIDSYKDKAEQYVDSIMHLLPIKEIKRQDEEFYNKFANRNKAKLSATMQNFKEGRIANDQVELIIETGLNYLPHISTKKEYKQLNGWINYCYKLIPGKYTVDNLKAKMLYQQGKLDEAITLKKTAVEKMPERMKKKVNEEHELEEWQQEAEK